jgi:hypothetical protein
MEIVHFPSFINTLYSSHRPYLYFKKMEIIYGCDIFKAELMKIEI